LGFFIGKGSNHKGEPSLVMIRPCEGRPAWALADNLGIGQGPHLLTVPLSKPQYLDVGRTKFVRGGRQATREESGA
jgi:hypothetical protein